MDHSAICLYSYILELSTVELSTIAGWLARRHETVLL
jgi:hypothetical protein